MFKYFLYRIGQFITNIFSLKISYKIVQFISDIQYFISARDRRSVQNNLIRIVGEKNYHSSMTKEVFRNMGKYLLEFFRIEKMLNEDFIKNNVKFLNIERIEEVLKKGKGGIILTAHIGNWELGGIVLSMLGYPVKAVVLPHRERQVNNLFNQQRAFKGNEVIPIERAGRECIEALKDNQLVALLADRDFTSSGEKMDFLGTQAFLPKGVALFSEKTGAPILPTFLIRENLYFSFLVRGLD